MNKEYIGDGVYVEYDNDGYGIILTTENGIEITNTIYLEAEVLDLLNSYLRRMFLKGNLSKNAKETTT